MIILRTLKIVVVLLLVVLAIASMFILVSFLSHLLGVRKDAALPPSAVPVLASILFVGAWLYFALFRIKRTIARAEDRRRSFMELPELKAEMTASTRQALFLSRALFLLIGLTSIAFGIRSAEYWILGLGVVITVATLVSLAFRPTRRGGVLSIDGQRVTRQSEAAIRWEEVVDVSLNWRLVIPSALVPFPFLVLTRQGKRKVSIPVYGLTMTLKEIYAYAQARWGAAHKQGSE